MRLPGVNGELANAVRAINAARARLPEPRRPDISRAEWLALAEKLDALCERGDRDSAIAAVEAWRDVNLRRIEEAR